MKCPNCGMNMKRSFCAHCGYMTNGIIINTKKPIEYPLLEIYFGKKFDKIIRNDNWLVPAILGPVYIFCHRYYLIGLLLLLADILVSLFFFIINHVFLIPLVVSIFNFIYWFFNRLFWATVGNVIYLSLLSKKLVKIKEKHPDNYKEAIQKLYKRDHFLLPLKCLIFGLISFIMFICLREIIRSYIWF